MGHSRSVRPGNLRLVIFSLFFAERVGEAWPKAAQDQELVLLDPVDLAFGGLGDEACIKPEQCGRRPHIAFEGLRRQRLDQRALLSDAARLTPLAHGDLLAQFRRKVGRQVGSEVGTEGMSAEKSPATRFHPHQTPPGQEAKIRLMAQDEIFASARPSLMMDPPDTGSVSAKARA